MSNRRFRVKTTVNLGALSNGRRKLAEETDVSNKDQITSENDSIVDDASSHEKSTNMHSDSEDSSITSSSVRNVKLEATEVEKSPVQSEESNGHDPTCTSKNDNPFSPPPPPGPNTSWQKGIRFKAKFRPNLSDKSRIRRYSGTLPDLGSPQMIGSPNKKLRTISCSSSAENDSDIELISHEDVPMRKPTLFQKASSSSETVSSSVQASPSPNRWSRQSPAVQPDYDIKSPHHLSASPSPRQRHTTETREMLESIENKDPSVLEVRKADFKKKFNTGVPERTTMTMFDLIFYNPGTGSRMSNSNSRSSSRASSRLNSRTSSMVDPKEEYQSKLEAVRQRLEEEAVDDVEPPSEEKDQSEDDDAMPVPQVKVGPDGSIIVDDSSTLIETTASKKAKEDLLKTQLIFESADKTINYGSWLKRKKAIDWTDKETVRFFKALSILGTDFSLMEKLFKRRTRHELKMKYKKEEKINKALIDRCLTKGLHFDLSILESEDDEEEVEANQPKPKQKKPRKKPERTTKQKKRKRGYYVSSEEEEPVEEVQPPRAKKRRTKKNLGVTDILNQGINMVPSAYQNLANGTDQNDKQDDENHVSSATSSPNRTSRLGRLDQGSGSLLKSLLTRNATASPQQTGFAFPPALLAANPGLANATPGSLVVVASPSGLSSDTDAQVLQVFVVGESNDGRSLSEQFDIGIAEDQTDDIAIQEATGGIVPLA